MKQPIDLQKVGQVEQTDDNLLDDVASLRGELAAASPGRESGLMRLLLSRVATNNMFQFCALLDAHGTMWDANDAALRGAGLTRGDVHGKPFWEARWWQSSPDAPGQLKEAIKRAVHGEFVRYDVDILGRKAGEEIITIDFNIKPVPDRDGAVCFLICEGRDVTEQRRDSPSIVLSARANEEAKVEGLRIRADALREIEETLEAKVAERTAELARSHALLLAAAEEREKAEGQFGLLVKSVVDYAIYMLDPMGVITNWNAGAERIKGYSKEEIVGRHFSCFYTDEDRARGVPALALGTAAKVGKYEAEGWRVRKDGSRFWANVVIDAIRSEDGAVLGFAKITRDITERRDAQRALETAQEALFQSQKLDAIGQLTGGVAHDFNNLLMAVLGSLELARKRLPDDPKIISLIDNAILGAQRGASLTQRMLAFARRQDLDLEPIDVPTLVRGMADLLQRSIGPSVAIELRFPLSLGLVQADANQLELALLNLVVNARDAMPGGGIISIATREDTVELAHNSSLKPGRYVCLSVTDAGEGMDEATLARATEPFFTTKGIGKGTGLGLPMVHGVAEQSGGRLILKSQKGKGTTAELWLPLATDPEPVGRARSAPPKPGRTTPPLIVVAVDDDHLVLTNTAAMLEELGHTVFKATGGKQALDILRENAIDLVITDQAMPSMTGAQLAEAIRGEWPDLAIILATGYAELAPGAGDGLPRLSKPFGQIELAGAIAQALTDSAPSRET